ncbi:3-phytase [Aurantiacibacter xanthus]|uniref:3-phytase n=1 Tax=Aurantiacibacter xanthus TaxID=1784712 RepID=A0A3A1P199_9SPHN|nr:phytase [Aurantiacibacter xanthus]RIV80614.1 3-phytase [Aurantiacibacter xanthus]
MRNTIAMVMVAAGLSACSTTTPIEGLPAVTVTALAETAPVGTANEDAADDPAIWRNAANPAASLIVATDKKGGLYVYDLSGAQKSFLPADRLNNVDLLTLPDGRVIVAASDRSDEANIHIYLAELDTARATLAPLGRVPVGAGEGYGICKGDVAADGRFVIYSVPKEGTIYRTSLSLAGGDIAASTDVLNSVDTQPEGCIYDERSGTLYIGEEDVGLWAMDGRNAGNPKRMVAPVDNRYLVADLEGLAIAPEGADGGYLLASSQGDNAYALFALPDGRPVGRFRIAAGTFGATEETDGIELALGSFGPDYPQGLFIAQDGQNAPAAQNFKLVSWQDIKAALELP